MRHLCNSGAAFLLLGCLAYTPVISAPLPQDNSATATIHAQTRVVQIEVIVKDAKGHAVANLSKKDFTVTDQGKPRPIDIFSLEATPSSPPQSTRTIQTPMSQGLPAQRTPLAAPAVFSNRNNQAPAGSAHSTAILLDQVNSPIENAAWARQGVLDLANKLPPDERIALYVIGRWEGLILLQNFTSDRALLLKSMHDYVPRYYRAGGFPEPKRAATDSGEVRYAPGALGRADEEPYEDTVEDVRLALQNLTDHLALVPGRKSVFWLSTGFGPRRMNNGKWEESPTWKKTITALNEGDVAVNVVDTARSHRDPAWGGAPLVMQQLADETGGKAWFPINSNEIGTALTQGVEESRTAYTLGFYLAENERDDTFHNLKVTLAKPGLTLSYRTGYYAGDTILPVSKPEKDELLETSLLNQVDSHDVGITAKVEVVSGTPRGTLNINLNLDTNTLSLKSTNDLWTGKIDEMFVELNDTGRTLARISDVKDFEFTTASRQHYDGAGVHWPMSIPLVAGTVKLAIIVRDAATGRVGTLTVPVI